MTGWNPVQGSKITLSHFMPKKAKISSAHMDRFARRMTLPFYLIKDNGYALYLVLSNCIYRIASGGYYGYRFVTAAMCRDFTDTVLTKKKL